jgi:hypothetical protein
VKIHLVFLALTLVSCSKNQNAALCVAGDQKSCPCTDGSQGLQVCRFDGTYSSCGSCLGGGGDMAGGGGADSGSPDLLPSNLCPSVMIVLDGSGSMDLAPDGSFTTPTKMTLAKQAIQTMVTNHGDQVPFGFTSFQGDICTAGAGDMVNIVVEPAGGTKGAVINAANAVTANGGTNTLLAVQKVAADPKMHDTSRPGSYVVLITDGEPTCSGDPAMTVSAIMTAANAFYPMRTFVVGFGALPTADQTAMDQMAQAGGQPCSGASCNGHQFYAADSGTALNSTIDAIVTQIVAVLPTCRN